MDFNPADANRVASCGTDKEIKLWRVGDGRGREPGRDARRDAHRRTQDGELRALLPRSGTRSIASHARGRYRRGDRLAPSDKQATNQHGDRDHLAHLRGAPRALRRRPGSRVGAGGAAHRHRLRRQRVHRVGRGQGRGRAPPSGTHALRPGRRLGSLTASTSFRRAGDPHGATCSPPAAPGAAHKMFLSASVQATGVPEGGQRRAVDANPDCSTTTRRSQRPDGRSAWTAQRDAVFGAPPRGTTPWAASSDARVVALRLHRWVTASITATTRQRARAGVTYLYPRDAFHRAPRCAFRNRARGARPVLARRSVNGRRGMVPTSEEDGRPRSAKCGGRRDRGSPREDHGDDGRAGGGGDAKLGSSASRMGARFDLPTACSSPCAPRTPSPCTTRRGRPRGVRLVDCTTPPSRTRRGPRGDTRWW